MKDVWNKRDALLTVDRKIQIFSFDRGERLQLEMVTFVVLQFPIVSAVQRGSRHVGR